VRLSALGLFAICGSLCVVGETARLRAATITVPQGGDVQAALNRAQPGDTVELAAGATFVGNYTLPPKTGAASFITVQSTPDQALPAGEQRVLPSDAHRLAKVRSPNSLPALQTAPGAHHWRIQLLEFQGNAGGFGDIITLGDGSAAQSSLALVPHDLVVDRCYIHGDPEAGQKRGIALNSASTTVSGSYISDIKLIGQDSQAITAWNGPGPYTIANNYLEAAGENLLFGGADPSIPNLIPSDISVTGNTLSRPTSWRDQRWQVKNLLELKNARRITIAGNVIENNWLAAQSGFAILFTVRNQDHRCAWCQVEDVVFENNLVQHSAAGILVLGYDNNAKSEQTRGIVVRNNLFVDIDNERWGGNGYFLQLTGQPRDITVDHNTIIQEHAYGIVQVEGPPVLGFVFTNNIVRHNAYGIIGASHAPGNDTISAFFPASRVEGNIIADGVAGRYPSGNRFPTAAEFQRQFVGYGRGDYRLVIGSSLSEAGIGGATPGADLTTVPGGHPHVPRVPETPNRPMRRGQQ
jgi:hypothetical protein